MALTGAVAAAVVALAVLGARGDADTALVFAPSSLAPFEAELDAALIESGIGPVECVNVEHEEVLLMPRWVDCRRATFKYGLGEEMIGILKVLHQLGLDSTEKVSVKGVEVSPRDVVAAVLPQRALKAATHLAERDVPVACARAS